MSDSPRAPGRGRRQYDLDEVAPGRFVVRDPRAVTLLKPEGEVEGRLFTLRSWRRDGLLARLRERGFRVRTLDDRVAALPQLPTPPTLGPPAWRAIPAGERWSLFDPDALEWRPIEPEPDQPGCWLRSGRIIRRRKGHGPPGYAICERSALRALDEDTALLLAYAQAAEPGALRLSAEPDGDQLSLPDVPLPRPHRELLRSLASPTAGSHGRLLVPEAAWPIAQATFERLGLRLDAGE